MRILVILLLTTSVAVAAPTGKTVTCDKIGYLSTGCNDVEVLPLEYKYKEVAEATASADKTEQEINIVTIKREVKEAVEKAVEIKVEYEKE